VATQLTGGNSTTTLGGCFNLPDNQCGQCIAHNCEAPNGSPPVSLAKICALEMYSSVQSNVTACATTPSIGSYQCQDSFLEGGAYAPSIDNVSAAESNLKKCIFDNCFTSCSECLVSVLSCSNSTVSLIEAGTCGTCLDNAMNRPNSPCQMPVLQGACYTDPSSPVSKCAAGTAQCAQRDCSGLSAPPLTTDDAGYALYTCLWQQCQAMCQ
jgi:hypothetical protein